MSDFFGKIVSAVSLLCKLRPGLAKHCRERAVLSNALQSYRTPSNHHLRRALRLGWIRAANSLFQNRLKWAKKYPETDGASDIAGFEAAFSACAKRIIDVACNQDTGEAIGDSPIDDYLELVLDDLPDHLAGNAQDPRAAKSFAKTLSELTGWAVSELPKLLLDDAREGTAPDGMEHRNFDQLLLDEFARVVQDPEYSPEAGASVHVVQQGAMLELMRETKSEIREIAKQNTVDITAEDLAAVLDFPDSWLFDELAKGVQQANRKLDNLEIIANETREMVRAQAAGFAEFDSSAETRHALTIIESHTATQDRSVLCGGFRNDALVDDLMDEVSDELSRRASRLADEDLVVPVAWDFHGSESAKPVDSDYARSDAWTTVDDRVLGSVLILGQSLGSDLDSDEAFLEQLHDQGWFDCGESSPVVDMLGKRASEKLRQFRDCCCFPITYETRFALENLLRGKSLLVVAPGKNQKRSRALQNLLDFLFAHNVTCVDYSTIESSNWSGDFLSALPSSAAVRIPNPYRGLDYYEINDSDVFVGRKPEAASAHAIIENAVDDNCGTLLGIAGPSGSGKSSFLRARVAANAIKALDAKTIEFRPTDFRVPNESTIRTLPNLCFEIAQALFIEPPEELVGPLAPFWKAHLPKFKNWVDANISDACESPVLLCLDQFEEILDDLSEGIYEGEWRALLTMLTYLKERHNWHLIFTLEDSRKDRFDKLQSSLGLDEAQFVALPNFDNAFFKEIITKPFQVAGINLAEDIVATLLDEVNEQLESAAEYSSPLPLLGLKLYHLFRELSPRLAAGDKQSVLEREFTELHVSRADLGENDLKLGDMVADLADSAWTAGGGDNDPDHIAAFLRPLVRISLDRDDPEKTKMVLRSIKGRGYRDEQSIHDEFCRRRVLVPSGGGLRLVHEAVIRRWPKAKKWFEKNRKELADESAFRADALRWVEKGSHELNSATVAESDIELAVRILAANHRDWASADRPHLDPDTETLRRYAVEVFQLSNTPLKIVHPEDPGAAHIHIAATYGLNSLLKRFIELDPNCVDAPTKSANRTALSNAAWHHLSTVELLLSAGANPSSQSKNGFCALDSAIYADRLDICRLLVEGLDAESWDASRINPICGAANRENTELADLLSSRGFRHQQPTRENWTPLHSAATKDNLANFKYFLERGDLNARWVRRTPGTETVQIDRTPLHVAAANGCLDIVRYILSLEAGYDLLEDGGITGETPLILSAALHQAELVEYLLGMVEDPNSGCTSDQRKGLTALHLALVDVYSNPTQATARMKRRTKATVRALLRSPLLDVSVKSAQGLSVWDMAQGLPDLQSEIMRHPSFPDDQREEVRRKNRERILDELRQQLLKLAIDKRQDDFKTALAEFDAKEFLDTATVHVENHRHLSKVLLENDWLDLLIELIENGQIDPWRKADNYGGIYKQAIKKNNRRLIDILERGMPDDMPFEIAKATIMNRSDPLQEIDKSKYDKVVKRVSPETLNKVLFFAARAGNQVKFEELVAAGASAATTDNWGRTAIDVASDALRRGIGEEVDNDSRMPASFDIDADGWSPTELPETLHSLRDYEHVEWDAQTDVHEQHLPFYPDSASRLIRISNPNWRSTAAQVYRYWLLHDDTAYALTGTSPPIHEYNAKHGLKLTPDNVVEYLKFFCFFVRGEEGPFYIVDSMDAYYLPNEMKSSAADNQLRSVLAGIYRGPRQFGQNEDGHYRVSALIYYSNAMFVGNFVVHDTGMCELKDDWPLAADLPVKVDAPISFEGNGESASSS